jgi:hypothetical protein
MRLPIIALFTAALLTAQPVRADQDTPITRQGSADDEVVLMLEAEDWVETKTATVRVAADLAVESGAFGTARADFVATLSGFAIETTWRIVDFAKLRDDAGFERWTVTAEARVPEAALSDLTAKAKAATKPGRALQVAGIDYTPTLAERETVIDGLRARLYARVGVEIDTLNAAFAGRHFRVRLIDFTQSFRPEPRMMKTDVRLMRAEAAPAGAGGGLAGAEKAYLTARVHVAAEAPLPSSKP